MSETAEAIEQRIRERAYSLWEEAGQPEGRADEFWLRAQEEIQAEMNAGTAPQGGTEGKDRVDFESEQSFPASDPPAHTGIVGPGS